MAAVGTESLCLSVACQLKAQTLSRSSPHSPFLMGPLPPAAPRALDLSQLGCGDLPADGVAETTHLDFS